MICMSRDVLGNTEVCWWVWRLAVLSCEATVIFVVELKHELFPSHTLREH